MLINCVFLSVLFVLCIGSERTGWPGYEYFPELQGYLKVHLEPAYWHDARSTCHSEDALLSSPWSDAFVSTISRLLTTKYPTLPILYSGAGLRVGSPGIPMEPYHNKRCFVFLASGVMDKVVCNQQLPYACFAHEPISSCADNGYTYNSQTGQCYKFHSDTASAPNAKSTCISEGGFLAKISDPTEKTVLQSMSDGLTFIDNDDGGPEFRHLSNSGYTDYSCDGPHTYICERSSPVFKSDLID